MQFAVQPFLRSEGQDSVDFGIALVDDTVANDGHPVIAVVDVDAYVRILAVIGVIGLAVIVAYVIYAHACVNAIKSSGT
jgi:hypothetical protein